MAACEKGRAHARSRALRSGFTLVEVVVVVSVIAVVAAILLVVFARSREKGWQAVCVANLRELGQASLMYAQDNDGYLPPYRNLIPGSVCDGTSDGRAGACAPDLLSGALRPYGGKGGVMFCPADTVAGQAVVQWQVYHEHSSYKYQFRRTLELRDDGWYTKNQTVSASEYPLICDPNTSRELPPPPDGVPQDPPGGSHFDGVNTCYIDGHVKWVPPAKEW